ncbi:17-beta-hydroxysteroid dehydrogenase type 6-like [Ostrea edulis]|uniref:17-beta-hydroxysteroid dehydrogenase type 6-like n=1 Tax=Ostrea edulis TaxID=37623 RepID=UPI00209451C8|nr:17-beta-hydroxysteroid dehydrogenase type 6-like [Ostrea edulis]
MTPYALFILYWIILSLLSTAMSYEQSHDYGNLEDDDVIFYSVLYSVVTVVFAMAVLSKFLTNEFRLGFRSVLSLLVLFLGEPLCQFLIKGPGGVVTFAGCCLLIYSVLPASHLPVGNKAVLVTGCDSGIGHAVVRKLDSIGMRVYAACLDASSPGAISLRNNCSDSVHILQLDITNKKDIENIVSFIKDTVGSEGLWGLVNNAGVWYFSEIEMTSDTLLRKVLETNVLGAITLTRALLPQIRQAKGRIVNVSSLLGRITMDGNGAYAISKHALVAFSDTLRQEMKKWGVKVSIIEPTGFYTDNMKEHNIMRRKEEIWSTVENDEIRNTYGRQYFDSIYNSIKEGSNRYPSDLTPITRAIRSGLLSKRPRERFPCGTGAEFLLTLYPLLPVWMADSLSTSLGIMPRTIQPAALEH